MSEDPDSTRSQSIANLADRNRVALQLLQLFELVTNEDGACWETDGAYEIEDQLIANQCIDQRAYLFVKESMAHFFDHATGKTQEHADTQGTTNPDTNDSFVDDNSIQSNEPTKNHGPIEGSPTTDATPDNTLLNGRYQVLKRHAKGGLGIIFSATDLELGRQVAIKEMRFDRNPSSEDWQRFKFEGSITAKLEHPGIVPVYGLGANSKGRPYYAMRLIDGRSLRDELKAFYNSDVQDHERRVWLKKILVKFVQVCRTIGYTHQQGVLHRDLKPSNIMLGKHGETLVVDWGLAKAVGEPDLPPVPGSKFQASVSSSFSTQMGSMIGTLTYMSPEQADSADHTTLTDVFGLGATLFAICTGRSPYASRKNEELVTAVRTAEVDRVMEVSPWVPRPLAAICHKALSCNPSERYSSADAMADDLETWIAGEPVAAYRENALEQLGRLLVQHRTLFAGGALFLVASMIGLVVFNQTLSAKNRSILDAQQQTEQSREYAVRSVVSLIDEFKRNGMLLDSGVKRIPMMNEASAVVMELRKHRPDDAQLSFDAARISYYTGLLAFRVHNLADANFHFRYSEELLDSLDARQLKNPCDLDEIKAVFYCHLGQLLSRSERQKDAEISFQKSIAAVQRCYDEANSNAKIGFAKGLSQFGLASLHRQKNEIDQALSWNELAVKTLNAECANESSGSQEYGSLAAAYLELAKTLRLLERFAEAEKAIEDAEEIARVDINPLNDVECKRNLLLALIERVKIFRDRGDTEQFARSSAQADESSLTWDQFGQLPMFRLLRLEALVLRTQCLSALKNPSEAKKTLKDAIRQVDACRELIWSHDDFLNVIEIENLLSSIGADDKVREESLKSLDEILKAAATRFPDSAQLKQWLSNQSMR
ncbi:MAG: serine/threonine-protein kinase [Pirellulaceae bacterium]